MEHAISYLNRKAKLAEDITSLLRDYFNEYCTKGKHFDEHESLLKIMVFFINIRRDCEISQGMILELMGDELDEILNNS